MGKGESVSSLLIVVRKIQHVRFPTVYTKIKNIKHIMPDDNSTRRKIFKNQLK